MHKFLFTVGINIERNVDFSCVRKELTALSYLWRHLADGYKAVI